MNILLAQAVKKQKAKEKKEPGKMLATSTAGTAGGGMGAGAAAQQPSETTAEKQNYGSWVCPSMLLVFLQNTIEAQTAGSTGHHPPDLSPVTPLSPATDKGQASGGATNKDFKLKIGNWTDFK